MKRKRFSEEQIIRILHDAMDVADAKRQWTLERENAALKRLVGELTLASRMLKDVLGKTTFHRF